MLAVNAGFLGGPFSGAVGAKGKGVARLAPAGRHLIRGPQWPGPACAGKAGLEAGGAWREMKEQECVCRQRSSVDGSLAGPFPLPPPPPPFLPQAPLCPTAPHARYLVHRCAPRNCKAMGTQGQPGSLVWLVQVVRLPSWPSLLGEGAVDSGSVASADPHGGLDLSGLSHRACVPRCQPSVTRGN